MAHVLKQHGDNSVTYSFVVESPTDALTRADFLLLPNSRIKALLTKEYEDSLPSSYAQFVDDIAGVGFKAVITPLAGFGGIKAQLPLVGLTGSGEPTVTYAPVPLPPDYDPVEGTAGLLRLELAYSASE